MIRSLSLQLPSDGRARYLRIADAVRSSILSGRAKPGELIPSARDLAPFTRSHRFTVMAGLNELVAEGWLVPEERRGYRVNKTLPAEFFRASSPDTSASRVRPVRRFRVVRKPVVEQARLSAPKKFNFRSGYPDLRRFPTGEFKSCLWDALRRSGPKLMGYGDPAGHPDLIEALSEYLRRLRGVTDRAITVTHGSQEGIFLAAQLLIRPGDKVAVGSLGYPPAWDALRVAGARLLPVKVDKDGMDPDDFERVLSRNKIRLLYVTPLHQYPTTATLPVARRMRLYELASRRGVVILEDDYDHEFHYRSQPPAPLAANDPDGRVIYVSSFSKSLFPSARLGFMAVPKPLVGPLKAMRRIVTRQNDFLTQDAVARWMRSGGLERHLRRMRRIYHERRDLFVGELEELFRRDSGVSWTVPDGGMALWLETGADSLKTAECAARLGVSATPEGGLTLDGSRGTHLRLGFAFHEPGEARQGLQILARAIRKAR